MCENAALAAGLVDSDRLFRLVAENSCDMIVGYDVDLRRVYVSPASRAMLGCEPHELIGRVPFSDVHPDDRNVLVAALTHMLVGDARPFIHYRQRHRDGHYVWLEASYGPVADEVVGDGVRYVATVRDVSQKRAAEDAAAEAMVRANESLRLLSMAEEMAQVGHWRLHSGSRSFFWSPVVYRIHGLPPGGAPSIEEVLAAYHPDDQATVSKLLRAALRTAKDFEFRARIIRRNGELRHVVSRGQAEFASDGSVMGLFGVMQDVTNQAQAEAALQDARDRAEAAARTARRLAETDELTGLANRRMFLRQLDQEIVKSRDCARPLSAAIFDVDHFKSVNDRFGHAVGDAVLERIARIAVEAAGADRTIGRLGGEEFGVIMRDENLDHASAAGERIRSAIEQSIDEAAKLPVTTISMGIAMLDGTMAASGLLAAADEALYRAKRSGRNCVCVAA